MSAGRETIRSYQRLFRPERRLHQIEGRVLPIPGGVPLRWLGHAGGALLGVLALASGSLLVYGLLALGAALAGAVLGGRAGAAAAGTAAFAAAWLLGYALGFLDWPLRLLVAPAGVATLATQATPDGRRAHRFAASWLALRLSPRRRSLGRALPPAGVPRVEDGWAWVAPDEHAPQLRAARLRGEGTAVFAEEVSVRRSRLRQRRLRVDSGGRRGRGRAITTARLAISAEETVEVRP